MATIELEGMEFFARHGVYEEERITGNTFLIDLYLEVDTEKAETGDDINDAVDYGKIYEAVRQEMEVPSRLLEHLARRILNRLQGDFPRAESWEIRVSKLNPPLGGNVEAVSVVLSADSFHNA